MTSIINLIRNVYDRLTAGGSTEEQAIQSGIWVAANNIGDKILQLLKVIILARLLSPKAFGLLGIALLAVAGFKQFSQLGFDQALIQHKDENIDSYLDTAWVIKIIRGFSIASVTFIAAPQLAMFFGEPKAKFLIRIIGITPLILGLQNPAVVYFKKNLDFHREFIYQIGGRVIDLAIAITVATITQNVWALALGIIGMNITKLCLSYKVHNYRPSLNFNLEYCKEMFGFGKWIVLSSILVFLYGQGDDAFVGWFFTASSLGFYQIAYRFSNAPATEVTHIISRVAFPTFAKVQDNVDLLREGYFRVVQISSVIAFPMAAGIVAVAPQFVYAILGNQWSPMIPLIQILAIWGALRAFGSNVGAVFKAVGRPEFDVWLQAVKTTLVIFAIYPAAHYFGVLGVAFVIVGSALIVQPISVWLVLKIIQGDIRDLIKIVAFPLFSSVIMGAFVICVDRYLLYQRGILEFILLSFIGALAYFVLMVLVETFIEYDFINLYYDAQKSL